MISLWLPSVAMPRQQLQQTTLQDDGNVVDLTNLNDPSEISFCFFFPLLVGDTSHVASKWTKI
jgi:hypothetical protein